jgi:hypothetical protein
MYQQAATLRKQAQTLRLGRLTTFLLLAITAAGLPGCDETDPTGTDLTTSSEGAQVSAPAGGDGDSPALAPSTAAVSTIPLPINQSKATSGVLFGLTQTGTGPAGIFKITNAASTQFPLFVTTNGLSNAGFFLSSNSNNKASALLAQTNGGGFAGDFRGVGAGKGVLIATAGRQALDVSGGSSTFVIKGSANSGNAVGAVTAGTGAGGFFVNENTGFGVHGLATGNGNAAFFENTNGSTSKPPLLVRTDGTGFAGVFEASGNVGKGVLIQTNGGAGLQVVGGSKNVVVHTPSGAKALYTEESTEVWFTDYGFGRLANGRARVLLDPSFAQTINPDERYHVFLQAHGRGELYVTEMTPLGFEVALNDGGDANAEFSYRIVAKRLGFEGKRLEAAPWADRLPARD